MMNKLLTIQSPTLRCIDTPTFYRTTPWTPLSSSVSSFRMSPKFVDFRLVKGFSSCKPLSDPKTVSQPIRQPIRQPIPQPNSQTMRRTPWKLTGFNNVDKHQQSTLMTKSKWSDKLQPKWKHQSMSQSNPLAAFLTFAIFSAPYFYAVVMHNGEAKYVEDSYLVAACAVTVLAVICCSVVVIYFIIKDILECFTSNNKK